MLLTVLFSFSAFAETSSDDLLLADEAIQAPTIDIEGQYQVKEEEAAAEVKIEPVTVKEVKAAVKEVKEVKEVKVAKVAAPKKQILKIAQTDKLKIYRERLEERNKIMIEKKLEQIRFQQELALARHLEQSMNQTLKAIDTVK